MSTTAEHHYGAELVWHGDHTREYERYTRALVIHIAGKPDLRTTADVPFRGDPALENPEDLLLASLSSCHMLTYLTY